MWEGGLFKLTVTFGDGELGPILLSERRRLMIASRIPNKTTEMYYARQLSTLRMTDENRQIHSALVPPKRLSIWYRLPVYPE